MPSPDDMPAPVFPAPPWELEELVRFGGGMMAAVGLVLAAGLLLPAFFKDPMFVQHVAGWVVFHGGILVLAHRMIRAQGTTWRAAFGLDRFRAVGAGLATGVVVLVAALVLADLCTRALRAAGLPADSQESVRMLRAGLTPARLVVFGFGAVILAPVAEEVLFRGVLFRAVAERGWIRAAYLGSAALFAAVHLNLAGTLAFALIGFAAAWVYRRTGSLLAPISLHVLFNAANFLALVGLPERLKPYFNG